MTKDEKNVVSEISLYAAGRGYLEAAKMLYCSPFYAEKAIQVKLPLDLLIGFSIELLLKAYLRHVGWSQKNTHDIIDLHDEALARGLPLLHANLPELINVLGPVHKANDSRYMPDDRTFPLLNLPLTLAAVDSLETFVGQVLNALEVVLARRDHAQPAPALLEQSEQLTLSASNPSG
jgi:hypothetical protein